MNRICPVSGAGERETFTKERKKIEREMSNERKAVNWIKLYSKIFAVEVREDNVPNVQLIYIDRCGGEQNEG